MGVGGADYLILKHPVLLAYHWTKCLLVELTGGTDGHVSGVRCSVSQWSDAQSLSVYVSRKLKVISRACQERSKNYGTGNISFYTSLLVTAAGRVIRFSLGMW
jgi:hypothetical protein